MSRHVLYPNHTPNTPTIIAGIPTAKAMISDELHACMFWPVDGFGELLESGVHELVGDDIFVLGTVPGVICVLMPDAVVLIVVPLHRTSTEYAFSPSPSPRAIDVVCVKPSMLK